MGKSGVGRLVFKGDSKKKKNQSKKAKLKSSNELVSKPSDSEPTNSSSRENAISSSASGIPVMKEGRGLISSSGSTVMGSNGTKFTKQFRNGDAIVVNVPSEESHENSREEMRVVKMVLSDISCSISSAFSSDLKVPLTFQFINAPRNEREERRKRDEAMQNEKAEGEKVAFGTYASKNELVYREKSTTGTSYVIRKEALGREASRGELLAMRQKKKSDRYC